MVLFDYDSINSRIITTLQSKALWANLALTGSDRQLISAVSQEMAYGHQYKEYQTFENFWGKARNKSSLLVEAPVHGYKVPTKIGATGTMRVGPSSDFSVAAVNNIAVLKYFQFSNGTTFVATTEDHQISSGQMFIDVLVRQGASKTVTFLAQGLAFETKQVIEPSLENVQFDLYVNGVLWTNINSIYNANAGDQVYEIIYDSSLGFFTLRFGNGVFGQGLNLNDSVLFKYLSTDGSLGNISSTGNLTTVETQAYDSLGNPITLYCTNLTAISGGSDYPTLEQIRSVSPQVYQTGDRATSRTDVSTIISKLSYISKVYDWGVYETNKDNNVDPWTFIPTEENLVHIAALDASFSNLTTAEINQLVDDIHGNADPTDIYSIATVEIVNLFFNVDAKVINTSFSLVAVKNNIITTLQNTYGISVAQFNNNVYNSDFQSLVDGVTGVKYHDSTISIVKTFSFTSPYIASPTLPIVPVLGPSAIFYVKLVTDPDTAYVQFGQADANGIINASVGYNTNGSSINLTTGAVILIVNSGLSGTFSNYVVKVVYTVNSPDFLLSSRSQIFAYLGSNVVTSYAKV